MTKMQKVFPMRSFESLQVGEKVELTVLADEKAHQAFANLFNDHSPIHTDEDFCAGTSFGRRIGYAFFLSGLLSHVYGHHLPGGSSVCMKQEAEYRKPFYIGDNIHLRSELIGKSEAAQVLEIETTMYRNGWDECIFRGRGIVQLTKFVKKGSI